MSSEISKYATDAQDGLLRIEKAVLKLLAEAPWGLTNSAIATSLGLKTSGLNGQKNYLTWSILQEMVRRDTLSLEPSQIRKREILYSVKTSN